MLSRDNSFEQYYVDSVGNDPNHRKKQMDNAYMQASPLNQAWQAEAHTDTQFKAGEQSTWNPMYGVGNPNQRRLYFNRIRRVTNMVTGYQRQHRKSVVAIPVENADDQTASQYSACMIWAANRCHFQDVVSRTFDAGAVTTGMGLVNFWMDYTDDFSSGDISCDYVGYSDVLIDPYFKKLDLSDCNFVWRRQILSKNALKRLMPGREKEIDKLCNKGNKDGRFQFQAQTYNSTQSDLSTYDEYFHLDYREKTIILDMETQESFEWAGRDDQDENLNRLMATNSRIKKRTVLVPTVKLVICVDGHVWYDGPNPLEIDRYPFVPVMGYWEPNLASSMRIQGIVRGLRDAQFLYNRRKVIELDIMESQVTSGFKYKIDSLVNPEDIKMTGQGRGIALKKQADMMDVERIHAPDIPASMIQLSELMGREIMEISGVNEELLGSATDDKAGVLSMLRQGAGLITLQTLFDQLDSSVRIMGSIMLQLIQKHFTPSKVARIIGEQPAPQFYDQAFGKYDVEIEEALLTSTQRQIQFAQLLQLRELGIPVPTGLLIEQSTVQNKQKLVEAIAQAEQEQQQQQQMSMQLEMQRLKTETEALEARAIADQGLGIERMSRVQENRSLSVQREAEAVENITQARLNKVKAIKEIESMDLSQIKMLLDMIQSVMLNSEAKEVETVARDNLADEARMTQM